MSDTPKYMKSHSVGCQQKTTEIKKSHSVRFDEDSHSGLGDSQQSGKNRRISFAANVKSHRARSASQWSRLGVDEEFRGRIDTTGSTWSQFSFTYGTKEIRPLEDNYTDIGNRPSLRQLLHQGEENLHTDESENEEAAEDEEKDQTDKGKPGSIKNGDSVKYIRDNSGNSSVDIKLKIVNSIPPTSEPEKFDWVRGVLARCLLNIWGVMIFLRIPWCVGHAGILEMTSIILLSTVVTIITTLSMSAICTNGFIKGGGAYYLISRSLGPEIGGAVGIMFAFANAVAVAMYIVGFAETVRGVLIEQGLLAADWDLWDIRLIGLVTCIVILAVALLSLSLVVKVQLSLLVLLIVAILDVTLGSFVSPPWRDDRTKYGFTGYNYTTFSTNLMSDYGQKENYFTVFAIFFPAATGILAGANISGNLKDPEKAIPKGTLLAIVISTFTYIALSFLCGAVMVRELESDGMIQGLKNLDSQVMANISFTYVILVGGIVAASLSSAIASLVGAPKVFQAICKDHLFPYVGAIGKGSPKDDEPRRGYILTALIGLAFVAVGELNVIAPLISNFFLVSYALINGACFMGSVSKAPSWRPSFRFYNKWLALIGFLSCSSIMFMIDYFTALISYFVIGALFVYLVVRDPNVNWGTSTSAFAYLSTLHSILKLQNSADHVKTYRPQILAVSGDPKKHQELVTLASAITKNSSMMICGNIIDKANTNKSVPEFKEVKDWLMDNKIKSFYCPFFCSNFRQGVSCLLQTCGIGKFRPNILFLGYKYNWKLAHPKDVEDYVNVIYDTFDFNCAVCILRLPKKTAKLIEQTNETEDDENDQPDTAISISTPTQHENIFRARQSKGTIDIWWLYDDGGLSILIPHLISLNWKWSGCQLRIFISGSRSKLDDDHGVMLKMLQKFRINVKFLKVIPELKSKPSREEWKKYEAMQKEFETEHDEKNAYISAKAKEDPNNLRVTKRNVRIGELVRMHSSKSTMVIINMPLPRNLDQAQYQYMCWLETLSENLPPTILMRGNQENVLTFYS
ncbi:solute carrier family 12 member 2-like isoform X2 [Symsagittifera roscoffensis]|uniref:solute carrier family 12 member 2-like isoform X2 n=1 Tax=Symsagittifera roscoffensis TaxID=84072 RepID=UPI00307C6B5E